MIKQINDGNWRVKTPMSVEYSFPFSEVGDNSTFKARALYRQDKNAYSPTQPMSIANFPLGNAYLTKLGEPRDIGCGLYEYIDEYSNLPISRTEYGSFTFTGQWFEASSKSDVDPSKYFYDVSIDFEEQTFTVGASFLYEYFLFQPPQPLLKRRMFLLFGLPFTIGGAPVIDQKIVAEDSSVTIYAGRIYQRRTPYVSLIPQSYG